MSEKKVVVPKEMLKYAINYTALPDGCGYDIVETILRRGLIYQSENPRVPTEEQYEEMRALYISRNGKSVDAHFYNWLPVEWQRRMYLSPEPEYGVCKKCGARVQDGATKSHSSAAGTLLPGHTEPEVLPCSKCGSKDRNQFINILVCCGCSRILAHIINGKAEYIKGSLRENTEPSVPEGIEDLTMDILSSENGTCRILVANALIKEAYRRGKESK